jgi:hydroxylaminobenzene mutase
MTTATASRGVSAPEASPSRATAAPAAPTTRAASHAARRLMWHGSFLFLLGLLTGLAIPMAENPRMALSSHLEGVMNGTVLLVAGLAWQRLTLSRSAGRWLFGLLLYGTYANWASTFAAALVGTGRSTPIAGAGHAGAPWQEALVDFGLYSLSFAMVAAVIVILRGLRRVDA